MGYYGQAGSGYYDRGDYYRRGDPILPLLGGIISAGTSLIGKALGGKIPGFGSPKKPFSMPTVPFLGPLRKEQPKGGKKVGGHFNRKGEFVYAHSRRMNVTNPKALRRAIRRAQGFERLAMKVLAFTKPHGRPKGRPYFKRARRRAA